MMVLALPIAPLASMDVLVKHTTVSGRGNERAT
jgi:hypothetical protein